MFWLFFFFLQDVKGQESFFCHTFNSTHSSHSKKTLICMGMHVSASCLQRWIGNKPLVSENYSFFRVSLELQKSILTAAVLTTPHPTSSSPLLPAASPHYYRQFPNKLYSPNPKICDPCGEIQLQNSWFAWDTSSSSVVAYLGF